MNNSFLFAIDTDTEEVIVSDSPKGSHTINFIERSNGKKFNELYEKYK